jgi:magnesium transporter
MNAIKNRINYKHFEWIDICHPEEKDLNQIAQTYQLDYFQIKDSLDVGHLPKFEKLPKYNFLILRSYTAKEQDRVTNVNELSNKIAFFYNQDQIITVHRSEFDFLHQVSIDFEGSFDLLIYIVHKLMQTFVAPSQILSREIDDIGHAIFIKHDSKISL